MKKLNYNTLLEITGGKAESCSSKRIAAHAFAGFLMGALSLNPIGAATGAVIGGVTCSV